MMNISSKDRFPHIRQLKRLGGDKSADGEEYYEEHEKELSEEYEEIMSIVVAREMIGDSKKIHYGTER